MVTIQGGKKVPLRAVKILFLFLIAISLSGCYATKQLWNNLIPQRNTELIVEPHKFACKQDVTEGRDFSACKQQEETVQ